MIEYPTKILLATEGTENSNYAAQAAISLSVKTVAGLHVVHVGRVGSSATGTGVPGGSLPGEPSDYARRQAEKLLDEQVTLIQAEGGEIAGATLEWASQRRRL